MGDDEHLAPQELADRTRVPLAVLRSLEASGVIRARQGERRCLLHGADVRAVRMLLSLLGVGLPMEEFMRLARLQIATMQEVAGGAVQLYSKYVGEPLRAAGLDPHEEEERAEAAFSLLVQAATSLVAYSFERMLRNAWAAEKSGAGAVASSAVERIILIESDARMAKWHTRWTQNPLSERTCGFDPRSGHPQLELPNTGSIRVRNVQVC